MTRLDQDPQNILIEEIKQLRIDVDQLKTDQGVPTPADIMANKFNIEFEGNLSITPPASMPPIVPLTASFEHDLGFEPAFLAFVTNPPGITGVGFISPGLSNLPSTVYISNSGSIILVSTARVDTTHFYVDLTYLGSPGNALGLDAFTWNYKYYILKETAN